MDDEVQPVPEYVTAVEVVDVRGIEPNRVSQFMAYARDRPGVRLNKERAERVVGLYRQLPRGEQARCHKPSYGLRMFREDRIVYQASICWECNNIFGEANGRSFSIEFDCSSSVAQELLLEMQNAISVYDSASGARGKGRYGDQ
jgi:hypothetical protein